MSPLTPQHSRTTMVVPSSRCASAPPPVCVPDVIGFLIFFWNLRVLIKIGALAVWLQNKKTKYIYIYILWAPGSPIRNYAGSHNNLTLWYPNLRAINLWSFFVGSRTACICAFCHHALTPTSITQNTNTSASRWWWLLLLSLLEK